MDTMTATKVLGGFCGGLEETVMGANRAMKQGRNCKDKIMCLTEFTYIYLAD